jgi:putative ABC transport system ATP-binding protein
MNEVSRQYMVEIVNICKHYKMGKVCLEALKGVSLKIERGSYSALVGESGCGKTTTLNIIGGLTRASSGQVVLDGEEIGKLSDRKLSRLRNRHIGFVFQDFNLIDVYTAYENIAYPLYLAGVSRRERKKQVLEMLDRVAMGQYARHRPTELSGGQKQRIAIARALIVKPKLVLADEPTANLDSKNSEIILQLMQQLNKDLGTTLVVATHSQRVMQYAGTVWTLQDGSLVGQKG